MVRMVAMTASEMSSQVGATKMSAASANSSPSRIQVAKRSQIWRPSNPVAWPRGHGLQRAEGDDEHGAALDGESDVARDQSELLLKRCVQAPKPPTLTSNGRCETRMQGLARGELRLDHKQSA